jgi:hypothetical protein
MKEDSKPEPKPQPSVPPPRPPRRTTTVVGSDDSDDPKWKRPKKETVRINLPPKPIAGPTIKFPKIER